MSGMSDYWARKVLDHTTGKTSIGSLPTIYVALFTAAPTDAGGGTEVSGGSYARVATSGTTWNAAAGSAPASTSNANSITFPTATADWGTVVAFGLFDASTSGNLIAWDYLGNHAWKPFTGSAASPCVLTVPAHGYANGDSVVVTEEYGGTLPATGGSWSGLKTVANATTDTFTCGVNTTGTGNGLVRKVAAQSVPSGVTASFAGGTPGNLVLTLA
jgi:hypothetical protein